MIPGTKVAISVEPLFSSKKLGWWWVWLAELNDIG